jgi:hypothetical protein
MYLTYILKSNEFCRNAATAIFASRRKIAFFAIETIGDQRFTSRSISVNSCACAGQTQM